MSAAKPRQASREFVALFAFDGASLRTGGMRGLSLAVGTTVRDVGEVSERGRFPSWGHCAPCPPVRWNTARRPAAHPEAEDPLWVCCCGVHSARFNHTRQQFNRPLPKAPQVANTPAAGARPVAADCRHAARLTHFMIMGDVVRMPPCRGAVAPWCRCAAPRRATPRCAGVPGRRQLGLAQVQSFDGDGHATHRQAPQLG